MKSRKENNDYNFIKKFSKITITKICNEEKIDTSNVLNGRTSEKNLSKVKNRLDVEIKKLYKGEKNNVNKTNTL